MTNERVFRDVARPNWALYRYLLLWFLSATGIIAGAILLSIGTITVWTPTGTGTESEASLVSVVPWGQPLLQGGVALAVVLLILDTYVGPAFRRGASVPAQKSAETSK